jgi:hypothetical protein
VNRLTRRETDWPRTASLRILGSWAVYWHREKYRRISPSDAEASFKRPSIVHLGDRQVRAPCVIERPHQSIVPSFLTPTVWITLPAERATGPLSPSPRLNPSPSWCRRIFAMAHRISVRLPKTGAWSRFALPQASIQTRSLATHAQAPPVTQDATGSKGPTAMVFLNMGGPSTTDEVGDFLSRLFVR